MPTCIYFVKYLAQQYESLKFDAETLAFSDFMLSDERLAFVENRAVYKINVRNSNITLQTVISEKQNFFLHI